MIQTETTAAKRLLAFGWEWRIKPRGTPHLVLGSRTLCGRPARGMKRDRDRWYIGCFSCHDRAWSLLEKAAA